ncbi:MAG: hypothetical protein Q7J25_02880 [Vicinamibacterales bacterium]|nr:hypothetical protein [Vicinamibacterales bacterium]
MLIRRVAALCVALALVAALPAAAQDKKNQPKKLSKQEQQDIAALVKIADAVGQPLPTDFQATWAQHHFLKSSDGKTFIPFTLQLDPKAITGQGLALYVRAVKKGPAAAPADKDKKDDKKVEYPWDDIQFFDVPADGRVARALALAGGDYELFVGLKERATGKKNEVNKTSVFHKDLSVPDFNKPELTTSDILVARSVEAAPMLDAESQRANPYTFGTMKVTPSADGKFAKTAEFNVIFWIYGVTPAAMQKPDVLVEYSFHQRLAEGEKYFNKTAPQALNGQAFPAEFDLSLGHLVMGSLSVPLASFPAGDYRLEIKISDKPSGKTVTKNVTFTIAA